MPIFKTKTATDTALSLLLSFKNKNKRISILAYMLITSLLVDMTLSTFSDILQRQLATGFGIALLVIIIVLMFVGQYFLFGFAKGISKQIRNKILFHFNKVTSYLTIIQYVIAFILLLMILQIIITSSYHIGLIIAGTSLSYAVATIIMSLVSYKFFSWYNLDRNITVLLYGVAAIMVAISTGSHIFTHSSILLEKKLINVQQESNLRKTDFPDINSIRFGVVAVGFIFLYLYIIPLLLSFVFMYAGTAFLLHHYSKRVGRIRYFIVISLPLISIIGGMIPTLVAIPSGNFTFYNKNLVAFRIFTILSGTSGSMFIGIAFLTIARSIRQIHNQNSSHNNNVAVGNYMTISAYGVIMLAISLETPVYQAPYPPFGVAASSFIALTCYLYSLGIYSSAVSVSEDIKLRQGIRKFAANNQSKLLDSIGSAEMEKEIQGRVITLTKKHQGSLEEETGVQSSLVKMI